jgi:hypothetical protein
MSKRLLNQKTTWLWVLVTFFVLAFFYEGSGSIAHAAEETHVSQEHSEDTQHEAGGEEHHGTPFAYSLAWILLILVGAAALKGWGRIGGKKGTLLAKDHGESHHAPPFTGSIRSLSLLLVIIVFVLLLVELSVGHYNENVLFGLVRTGLKMTLGVMLMFYGIAFMHDDHDEDGEHGEDTSGAHH